jgi:hypothetical protein
MGFDKKNVIEFFNIQYNLLASFIVVLLCSIFKNILGRTSGENVAC